jgi:hypothetical protein
MIEDRHRDYRRRNAFNGLKKGTIAGLGRVQQQGIQTFFRLRESAVSEALCRAAQRTRDRRPPRRICRRVIVRIHAAAALVNAWALKKDKPCCPILE